jgi:hypothetical protein
MTSTASEHTRKRIYDHARSIERRKGPPPADAHDKARAETRAEKNDFLLRRKEARDKLVRGHNKEKMRDLRYIKGRGDQAHEKELKEFKVEWDKKERELDKRLHAKLEEAAKQSRAD